MSARWGRGIHDAAERLKIRRQDKYRELTNVILEQEVFVFDWHVGDGNVSFEHENAWNHNFHGESGLESWFIPARECLSSCCGLKLCHCDQLQSVVQHRHTHTHTHTTFLMNRTQSGKW